MDWPLLSFVILTRNRREQLLHAIISATGQEYPNKEIVVVDNASTDGTTEFVRSCFPNIKLVANRTNVGTAAGRNRGIEAAAGEYLLLLDDDCVLDGENVARSVVSQLRADPECGAVALRIADPVTGNKWPYDMSVGDDRPVVYESAVFCTGGVALRRKTLEDVGFFWEPLFIGHEDTELALRILSSGWRIMGRGDLVAWHPSPDSNAPRNPEREIYYNVRNTIWLALRTMPVSLMFSFVVPRCMRAGFLAVRVGKLALFVRAVVDCLREVPTCLRERRPLSRACVKRARRLSMRLWF